MGGVQVGWGGGVGKWGMCVQSMGEMGKDFYPNFLQHFVENIDRRSCNDGSRELTQVFHPHRKEFYFPSKIKRLPTENADPLLRQ